MENYNGKVNVLTNHNFPLYNSNFYSRVTKKADKPILNSYKIQFKSRNIIWEVIQNTVWWVAAFPGYAEDYIGRIRTLEKVEMNEEGRKRKVLLLKDGWSEYAILSND